jgi:2-keto-4-pentenoate hydratase/2-oxohepta-3-ene-1,7-dioic acid hydratase in catechol pathway
MKFASFRTSNGASYGIVNESGLIDLGERLRYKSLRELIAAGASRDAATFASETADHAIDDVTLLPPIPDPAHIFCVGTNYLDHLKEAQDAGLDRKQNPNPSIFTRFPDTLVGHGEALIRPKVSTQFDFETELAVIIGTGGRYIERNAAYDHIAGYTCFNDGSIRDWQFHTSQIVPGKNFWRTGSAGPWMVEASDIADPADLDIQLRLNGEVMQHSNTRHLIFDIPAIIAYVSSLVPLQPGDMIATGTPAGVGFSRKPPVFMKPGDICEVEITQVGLLRNSIKDESD